MAKADKKRGRATRINGDQTREKILNAAEELFGERGFAAVSLRDITREAGVTLALASYHFGTKENLLEEVVGRRATTLCAGREAALDALLASGEPDPRAILNAFMWPLFEWAASGEEGWPDYFRVLAHLGDGDERLGLLSRHFDPTAQRFVRALQAALPGADTSALVRAFTMALQVMLATVSQNSRVDSLTDGSVRSDDLAASYAVLLAFCTAGIEAVSRQMPDAHS